MRCALAYLVLFCDQWWWSWIIDYHRSFDDHTQMPSGNLAVRMCQRSLIIIVSNLFISVYHFTLASIAKHSWHINWLVQRRFDDSGLIRFGMVVFCIFGSVLYTILNYKCKVHMHCICNRHVSRAQTHQLPIFILQVDFLVHVARDACHTNVHKRLVWLFCILCDIHVINIYQGLLSSNRNWRISNLWC